MFGVIMQGSAMIAFMRAGLACDEVGGPGSGTMGGGLKRGRASNHFNPQAQAANTKCLTKLQVIKVYI